MTEDQEFDALRSARRNLSLDVPVWYFMLPQKPQPRVYSNDLLLDAEKPIKHKVKFELRYGRYGEEPRSVLCDAIFMDGEIIWTAFDGYIPRDQRAALSGGKP